MTEASVQPVPAGQEGQLFRRFWRDFLRKRAGLMLLTMLVSALEGSTLGLLSWMLEPLFDEVFASRSGEALIWVGLGILALFVFRALTSILGRWLMAIVNQNNAAEMQVALLRHLLTLDGDFYQKNPPGSLIERVQGDTIAAQATTQLVIAGIGRDLVALIGLFVVALMIDLHWTLVALVGTPLLLLPALALQRYIRRKTGQMRAESSMRATRLDEIFHGIQQVKLNRMEAYQSSRFGVIVDRIRRAEIKSVLGRATMPALVDVVTGIGFFAVLLLGGSEVVAGERTTGEFMAFFTAMALTFQPIRRLSELAGQRQIALASLDRIYALFDTRPRAQRPAVSTARPDHLPPEIRFDNVSFAYDETPVLQDLSFVAPAGKVTALVGASGAGKSTIFHLLTALAVPQSGRILIGGAETDAMSLADQRRLFAAVSQEAALFDESLRENLILGRDTITPAQLEHALEDANVAEFLARLPQGIDASAGPRGSALSGGQRQRVAIARALLADAPVLLLDEATSALDAASEQAVTAALARAQAGRTTLVIAHRLATVREADNILVMDQGRLAEEGTHEALLAKGGIYARLYALQFRD
ncbi:ABC transporter ATP-binding protein [Xinfangfangia sp. D13-10-4-6]|uniref:ABC transporter ATP-binding protein n=1 Tax=Pseudogemmobacter hezensis TaxID=2737662 RepID=UPI001553832C|nr:ABC transporter ATP-binding protein [Pseudogemmobacter hezensis]NPD15937.1 ABC transporter ATP-binding protein [Pseudogemmobacter hezensis]